MRVTLYVPIHLHRNEALGIAFYTRFDAIGNPERPPGPNVRLNAVPMVTPNNETIFVCRKKGVMTKKEILAMDELTEIWRSACKANNVPLKELFTSLQIH